MNNPIPVHTKFAEGTDDRSYEQTFSSLAHAYVQDKVPQLLPYELGFQLIEKSEDDNRAVGIFGFKVGKILIYIPVFFLNGAIKGTDLMFIYNIKRFVPLTELWFNKIQTWQLGDLGEPIDANSYARRLMYPNLMQLKPNTLKWASSQPLWLRPIIPLLVDVKKSPATTVEFPRCNIADVLSKSASAADRFITYLDAYPTRIVDLHRVYGMTLRNWVKLAQETVNRKKPYLDNNLDQFDSSKGKSHPARTLETTPDVYVIDLAEIDDKAGLDLSEDEAKRLAQKGYLTVDKRKATSEYITVIDPTGKSLTDEIGERYQTATCSGIHNVIFKDKNNPVRKCLILKDGPRRAAHSEYRDDSDYIGRYSYGPAQGTTNITLSDAPIFGRAIVVELSGRKPKRWCFSKHLDFLTAPKGTESVHDEKSENDGSNLTFDDLSLTSVTDAPLNKRIVITDGNVGVCVSLTKTVNKDGDVIHYAADSAYRITPVGINSPVNVDHVIVDPAVKSIRLVNNSLLVPATAKCITSEHDDDMGYEMMTYDDLHLHLRKIGSDCTTQIRYLGSGEYAINQKVGSFIGSLKTLVINHGLKEADAEQLLMQARENDAVHALIFPPEGTSVKQAQELKPFPKTPIPPEMTAIPTAENVGLMGNRPYQVTMEGFVPIQSDVHRDYPSSIEPLENAGNVDQLIRAAISSGQKEVLDTTVFSQLMKAVDDRDLIEQHLGAIIAGMDAVGRILFNLYFHYDAFKNRYDSDELDSLEQDLRQVFRSLGDVILKLEQRPLFADATDYKTVLGLSKE